MYIKKIKPLLSLVLTAFILCTFASYTASAQLLKAGSTGTKVKILQMNLNGLGYAKAATDGIYSTNTVSAVKIFQSANGLVVDGIAGEKTLNKIDSIVKALQNDLALLGYTTGAADGIYGTNTKNAVMRFQSANGLVADGLAGGKTLSKIAALKSGIGQSSSGSAIIKTTYQQTPSKVVKYSLKADGNKYITKNFQIKEFKCKDGSDTILIDHKLAALLQGIRDHFGRAVTINSAYRTKSHNAAQGGNSNSLHLYGQAADIKISGVTPLQLAQYAQSIGVKGIGRYSTFVHVDTRTSKYFWYTYNNKTTVISSFR